MQRVKHDRLRNGMRFYSHFNRVAHVSGIGVMAGSIHDPEGKSGLAHLTEHVITECSKKHTPREVSLLWRKYMGGADEDANVRTDRVSTFYGHDMLLWREHMFACFDMFAEMVRRPVIDPETVAAEMAAVRQEYFLRGIDDLTELLDDLVHEHLYEKNPARKRIDCMPEDLLSTKPADIRRFYKTRYVPGNTFVIMLGPSFEDVKNRTKRMFDDWPASPEPVFDYNHSDDMPFLSAVKQIQVVRPGIHQHHVALVFPTESYTSRDAETLDVLARILEMRLSSRLRRENRDPMKGVYRVEVKTERTFVHGLCAIKFATSSGEFAGEARAVVIQELLRLKNEFVLPDELDAIKSNLEYQYRSAFRDTFGALAEMIIDAVANGDEELGGLHDYQEKLHRVNRKKLREAANKYFLTQQYLDVEITPA